MAERKLTQIPKSDVAKVVSDFLEEAKSIKIEKNADGTWTVTAVF